MDVVPIIAWSILGLVVFVCFISYASCSGGSSHEPLKIGTCDTSLVNCVKTLGEAHKDKCYETYNICVQKGANKIP